MLTINADVSDGLVNGASGKVMHVVTNDDNEVTTVLVKFDNNHVGLKGMQSSHYRTIYTRAVPVAKYEIVFPAKGKKRSEITRLVSTNPSIGNHNTQSTRPDMRTNCY